MNEQRPLVPAILSTEDLHAHLALLPGWAVEGREIVKTYTFPTYLSGIKFVNSVAHQAEGMNHHPDLVVGWRKVTVRLTTHSAGGITELDLRLAQFCEQC